MLRYRCRNAACGWDGLLARPSRVHARARRVARAAAVERATRTRVNRLATALLLAITAAVAGTILWVRQVPMPLFGGEPDGPAKQRHDGKSLPSAVLVPPAGFTAAPLRPAGARAIVRRRQAH